MIQLNPAGTARQRGAGNLPRLLIELDPATSYSMMSLLRHCCNHPTAQIGAWDLYTLVNPPRTPTAPLAFHSP